MQHAANATDINILRQTILQLLSNMSAELYKTKTSHHWQVENGARFQIARDSHSLWDRSTYKYHMTKYTSCDCA